MDEEYLQKVDYVMKINIWIMRKYGKEFFKEAGLNESANTVEDLIKIKKVYDDIYEEINKEMPKMWYEYGFNNIKMENKNG